MFEKRFAAVPAQVFTADGGANGTVSVADTSLFKVKQQVVVAATGKPNLDQLEVKKVLSPTLMIVGPCTGNINATTNLSAYTVIAGANIFANEQKRPTIGADDFERATYEEEPTVAKRVILVDEFGNKYSEENPLPVGATFTGTISVGEVSQGDPNTDDKAWPVKIVGDSSAPGLSVSHSEITSVASGVETTIMTITPPPGGMRVSKIEVSGDTVALYRVKLNGDTLFNKRSWWTSFNQTFDFQDFANGLWLNQGQVVTITVVHTRPFLGSFEATAMSI